MPTMTVEMPPLHSGQRTVLNNPARFKVLAAGRRWGKSRLCAAVLCADGIRGKCSWWVWPTHDLGSIGWRMLKRLALQVPGVKKHEVERTVYFPTGGLVQLKSADKPERLRGEGLDRVIIDEAAHIRKFLEMWEQALRPCLSDRIGRAWFVSTPKGFNDFSELYKLGANANANANANGNWTSWRFPTSDNPFIDKAEIKAAKGDLPNLVFRQEYLAEFVQLAGALFQRKWFETIESAPPARYVRCWDLAVSTKQHADYTVGAKVGFTDAGELIIADVARGRWEWPDALRIISQTAKADGRKITQGIEDVGMQKGMYQMLLREPSLVGTPLVPVAVHKDKLTRASAWMARAEQSKVKLVRGNWVNGFLDEICAFPETAHDDQLDAVSGAVEMLTMGQAKAVNLAQAIAEHRRQKEIESRKAVQKKLGGEDTVLLLYRGGTGEPPVVIAGRTYFVTPGWQKQVPRVEAKIIVSERKGFVIVE